MSTLTLKANTTHHILSGALAGLIGGAVFGVLMTGMLPRVGRLVGQEKNIVGLTVHLAISAIIDVIHAVAAARLLAGRLPAVLTGMANGGIWWALGVVVLMPLGLGMPQMVFALGMPQWMSLMGHLIFGIVSALALAPIQKRI